MARVLCDEKDWEKIDLTVGIPFHRPSFIFAAIQNLLTLRGLLRME
jgi:hypothetical protein